MKNSVKDETIRRYCRKLGGITMKVYDWEAKYRLIFSWGENCNKMERYLQERNVKYSYHHSKNGTNSFFIL